MDKSDYRLWGIYAQAQPDTYMLRLKVPGGTLTTDQARAVARASERFAGGRMHLTTRMSVELHDLTEPDLEPVMEALASVSLTSRGACGGAVRGVAVSTLFGPNGHRAARLARAIQTHFTNNPAFERLPKKFKVGVDGSYDGARNRIQDAGFVWVGAEPEGGRFDLWLAGGLGREPRPAFLFREAVPEALALPVLESVLEMYCTFVPPGKRLKHLAAARGEAWLREEVERRMRERGEPHDVPTTDVLGGEAEDSPAPFRDAMEIPVFGGELTARQLIGVAEVADRFGDGRIALTADQDLALSLAEETNRALAAVALSPFALESTDPAARAPLRICPGSHQCRLGLASTRALARKLIAAFPDRCGRSWAISGCPNSCAQPQIADIGILCRKLSKPTNGDRLPLYQLWAKQGDGFGQIVAEDLTEAELHRAIRHALEMTC